MAKKKTTSKSYLVRDHTGAVVAVFDRFSPEENLEAAQDHATRLLQKGQPEAVVAEA